MAGLHGVLADVAQFGLTDKVSEAVSDYCALLFDNVQEFIGMNREELKEYETENAGLREKLESVEMGDDERKTLLETVAKNEERIEELKEFMGSRRILETGIKFSGGILDDVEPQLTDRFNIAPVTEKYTCLVAHYMKEYRAGLDARGDLSRDEYNEASGFLVDIDAFRFGVERVQEFFPEIARWHEECKRGEYRKLLVDDPVKLHSDLIVEYSTAYIADMGRRLRELRHDHDAFQSGLREHEAAKPGWRQNLATLGKAGKAWTDGRKKLVGEIAGNEEKMAELQKAREDCRDGWLSEHARKYAKEEIRSRHPEVIEACERHMARHWGKLNEERLEKQEARALDERDDVAEKKLDDGLRR